MSRGYAVPRLNRTMPGVREVMTLLLAAAALVACGSDVVTPPGPAPVASVVIGGASGPMQVGEIRQLTATAYDAGGSTLSGRTIEWSSSTASVVTVNGTGLVTAHGVGTAEIRASSEGIEGIFPVSVVATEPARVVALPSLITVDQGGSSQLEAAALSAGGDTIADVTFTWTAINTGVASVNAAGQLRGLSEGVTQVEVRAGSLADTALVAVLGPRSLLATAMVGGVPQVKMAPGTSFAVPVVLDLSRVSATGDLGAAQIDLHFDPAVLQFSSVEVKLNGGAQTNLASPGRLRLAVAATAPQGAAVFEVAVIHFTVAEDASPGAHSQLVLDFMGTPVSTSFGAYTSPVVISGRVGIAGS